MLKDPCGRPHHGGQTRGLAPTGKFVSVHADVALTLVRVFRSRIGLFFCALIAAFVLAISVSVVAQDTLHARIIWVENGRVYVNAGTDKGVSVGRRFRIAAPDSTRMAAYEGAIDRVYPDLSSAPAGPLEKFSPQALLRLPDIEIFGAENGQPYLTHVRIGLVNGGRRFRLPEDIVEYPLAASLFYPWSRSGNLGDLGVLTTTGQSDRFDGRHWTLALDTACRAGGEFPGGWGALADRWQGIIGESDSVGCPTVWALRPLSGGVLSKMGVYFEGFSQVDDTALGFNYATPFYTLPEYVHSSEWRRAVAAAARYDPELLLTPSAWAKIGEQTWVSRLPLCDRVRQPFMIDSITVVPFQSYEDQWLALDLGDIDVADVSVADFLRTGERNLDVRFVSQTRNAVVVFGVNQKKKDLADNRLTTAVSYLVDKEAVVSALLAGRGVVTHTIFGDENLPAGEPFYPLDPAKGRRMLKDLGLRRTLNFYVDRRIDRGMAIAEHIAAKLADGGVKTRLVPGGGELFSDMGERDSMDVFLYLWPIDPQAPDATLYPFLYGPCVRCGTNPLVADDSRLLNLLEQARQQSDPAVRKRYYREIEYDLLAEPFICPLYRPIMTIAVRSTLPGMRLTAAGEIDIVPPGDSTEAGKAMR